MLTTYNDYTAEICAPTMRQKVLREALYFRLYAIDGTKRSEDETQDAIRENLQAFAVAAGLPAGTQLLGDAVEQFLDVATYVSRIDGASFEALPINATVEDMGKAFGQFMDLEEGFVTRILQVIRLQRRPSSMLTAPEPEALTDEEKKDVSSGSASS